MDFPTRRQPAGRTVSGDDTETTSTSRVSARPGLPRPTLQMEQFRNRVAPSSLGGGADDAALHITNLYQSKYSQSLPSLKVKTPWTFRRRTSEETTTQESRSSTGQRAKTGTQKTAAPAREGRSTSMQHGAEEGVLLDQPTLGSGPQRSTDVATYRFPHWTETWPRPAGELPREIPVLESRRVR